MTLFRCENYPCNSDSCSQTQFTWFSLYSSICSLNSAHQICMTVECVSAEFKVKIQVLPCFVSQIQGTQLCESLRLQLYNERNFAVTTSFFRNWMFVLNFSLLFTKLIALCVCSSCINIFFIVSHRHMTLCIVRDWRVRIWEMHQIVNENFLFWWINCLINVFLLNLAFKANWLGLAWCRRLWNNCRTYVPYERDDFSVGRQKWFGPNEMHGIG